jgi:uncharacterized iron-regulated membrane protein
MKRRSLRAWDVAHRWTSLICTAFMLLLCLTGLPLIFHQEIDRATGVAIEAPVREDSRHVPLDRVVDIAQLRHPDLAPLFASQEPRDDRVWYVTLGGTRLAQVAVDARDGAVLGEPVIGGEGVMAVVLSLHTDLFAGLPGKLFLGAMGVLLLVSLVSGVVLYAPFMGSLDFGDVRRDRATRVKWLDLHNLIGIVTLTWALVVGATGVINTWAELVVEHWQAGVMAEMNAPDHARMTTPPTGHFEEGLRAALALLDASSIAFVALPGSSFASPTHAAYFLRGATPLTSRLLRPVLVDARTGRVVDHRAVPWYLGALLLSQPLHFGDYGGLPLKVVWALLDLATIVVLGSGLYLWIVRRDRRPRSPEAFA